MRDSVGPKRSARAPHRGAGTIVCGALAAALVMLAGCVPIPVAEGTATAAGRCEPLPEGWNVVVGPDVGLERVHRLRTALAARLPGVEFMPAETVWTAVVPNGADRDAAPLSELLQALRGASAPALGDILLVVVLPERTELGRSYDQVVAPLYEVQVDRSRCEAALIPVEGGTGAVRIVGEAQGVSRSAWIPAGPLLFTRMYSITDTLAPARTELTARIAAEIAARSGGQPARVVLIGAR